MVALEGPPGPPAAKAGGGPRREGGQGGRGAKAGGGDLLGEGGVEEDVAQDVERVHLPSKPPRLEPAQTSPATPEWPAYTRTPTHPPLLLSDCRPTRIRVPNSDTRDPDPIQYLSGVKNCSD